VFAFVYGYTPQQVSEMTLSQYSALKKGSFLFMCLESASGNIQPKEVEKILDESYGLKKSKAVVLDEIKLMEMARDRFYKENQGRVPSIAELYKILAIIREELTENSK